MTNESLVGLTPAQIKDKFTLPDLPSKLVDVDVPIGTRIRTGTAGSVPGWGNGGGQQFELLDRIPENSYHNSRNIPKVKK